MQREERRGPFLDFRAHAAHNPRAVMGQRPMTLADHQASPMVADPFRLLDCCLESDGACAVVVTTAERARDLRPPPVELLASAQGSIQFVLRSGVDRDVVQIPPIKVEQLLAGSLPPPPPVAPKPTVPRPVVQAKVVAPVVVPQPVVAAPKPPEPHVIEVIQGTQRSIRKFEEADGKAASH